MSTKYSGMEESAPTRGRSADRNARAFEDTFARLGITNDDVLRPSQKRHTERGTVVRASGSR